MALIRSALVLILALFIVPRATAQSAVHLGAGRSEYDLSGVGWTTVASARFTQRVAGPLHVEGGGTWYHYSTATFLLPEVSAVLRASNVIEELDLFLGTGVGVALPIANARGVEMTLHVAPGFELRPDPHWGLRAEGRLRTSFPFGGVMTDLTVGPTFRF